FFFAPNRAKRIISIVLETPSLYIVLLSESHGELEFPEPFAQESAARKTLHHFTHLRILAQQVIYFLHGGSGSFGNTPAPRPVDEHVIIALANRHGIDDGHQAGDLFLVDLGVLELLQPANLR